jgi:hypothetical protein
MKTHCLAIASFLSICPALIAQGSVAQLLDGRILTPVSPPATFLTEGPITNVNAATQAFQAQGLTVTIPATVDGVAYEILGTNFNGAPISAATMHALLDENAAPGGRDAGTPLYRGAVRSIFSSGRLQLNNTQDAPNALATRTHMELVRSQLGTSHTVPILETEGIAVPGQADVLRPDRFEYSGATLKSAGQVYEDAQGNRFLIPDLEMGLEFAENLVAGPVTSVSTTGDYPSFVVGQMPVVLNPDPRFPVGISGLGGVTLSPQTFFQVLSTTPFASVNELIAEGYVVDGVLFAIHIECQFADPSLLPIVTIDRAQFDNARNEIRLRGIVDKPTGLTVRIELLRGDVIAGTFNAPIVVDPLLGGAGDWSFRQRGGITGGLATVNALRLSLVNAGGTVVNSRTWLRSEL